MRTSIISCILISLIPVPATLAATIPAERAIPPPDVNIEQLDRRNMPPVAHPPMPDWAASEAGGSFTFKWPGKDPSSGWQTKTWTQSIENGKKGKWELYQDWSEGLFGDTSVKIPALKSKKDREGKLGMSIQYWHESKSYKYEVSQQLLLFRLQESNNG